MLNIVFVGNSNVGKTTWMNYLCNTTFKVANYLGVSIDASEKSIVYKKQSLHFVDLPGIADLEVASGEEKYTKAYVLTHQIDVFVFVIDARNIQKAIPLFLQFYKLNIPMVVLFNFMNEKNKKAVHKFCALVDVPIVYGRFNNREAILDFIINAAKKHKEYSVKDKKLLNTSFLNEDKKKLHLILNHPILASIVFLLFLIGSVYLLFICSSPFVKAIENIMEIGKSYFIFSSIKIQKVFDILYFSLTTLFTFLPFLFGFYIWIAILEESGYMAYIAYIMHPYLKIFHLSGNSVIPFLVGYGCSVPAILSTRTIENEAERRKCAMLIPMLGCSGRIPIYILFISTFFKGYEPLLFLVLYGMSLLITLLIASFLPPRKAENVFVLELPYIQWPRCTTILKKVKIEMLHFLKKAIQIVGIGSILLVCSMYIENIKFLSLLFKPLGFMHHEDVIRSLPFALFSKENLVTYFTMATTNINLNTYLYSLWDITSLSALCYLLYISLNIPCVFTLATIKSEFGIKYMLQSLLIMFVVSYVVSFIVYHSMYFLHFMF